MAGKPSKRIIHIAAHYPPFLGGMEAVVQQISTGLANKGYSVEVVTSSLGYRLGYKDERIPGYRVTRLKAFVVFNLTIIPALFTKLLSAPKSSVFHVHIAQAFIPEVVLLAAKIRGLQTVAHFHLDVQPSGRFGAIFKLYKRTLFPWMLRNCTNVIVFSEDQKRLVVQKYGVMEKKVSVVPNGVGNEYFIESPKVLSGLEPKLLFVGRLSPQKNIAQLLHALEGCSDKFTTFIIGEGSSKTELVELMNRLNLKKVHFIGRKDGDELREYYKKSDIFILPSEREGMPLVALEAMASRLPVIGTNVLGTKDIVQENVNGMLVPLHDSMALRAAILALAENTVIYKKLSDGAYDTARQFTWHQALKLIEEVYAE